MSTTGLALLRRLVPARIRGAVRAWHRRRTFDSSFRAILADPLAGVASDERLRALVYGWGNDGWSAHSEYLRQMVQRVVTTDGPVLECGSGLSTLLLAAAARARGTKVHSLEHFPAWRARVTEELARHGLDGVGTVHDAPLQEYGEFAWYTFPSALRSLRFSTVICDGPPSTTLGGRYGLLPLAGPSLAPDAVILLDDAARAEEQALIRRWSAEVGATATLHGKEKPFAEIVLRIDGGVPPGGPAAGNAPHTAGTHPRA